MSHSRYTHTQSGNKAMILLGVLSDVTKSHVQYVFLMPCDCGVCMYGGRCSHTYAVLYIYTNSMHILGKLPLVLLLLTYSFLSP